MIAPQSRARAVLTVAAVVATCLPVASVSRAAAAAGRTGPHYRLTALAGSKDYLVYSRFRMVASKSHPGSLVHRYPGSLWELTRSGHRRRLGALTRASLDETFSVVGSRLFYLDEHDGRQELVPHLVDLRTGRTTFPPTPSGGYHGVGAAARGYLVEKRYADSPRGGPLGIASVHGSSVRPLANPFPGGQPFTVLTGSGTYVAFGGTSDGKGGIKTGSLRKPGKPTTLMPAQKLGPSFCGPPDASHVTCLIEWHYTTEVVRTFDTSTGKIVASTRSGCPGVVNNRPTVRGAAAFWVGCHHRLWRLTPHHRTAHSRYEFSENAKAPPVAALGQIVVTSKDRTTLYGIPGIHTHRHQLVTARS